LYLSVVCREEKPQILPDAVAESIRRYGPYGSVGAYIMTNEMCDDWPVPPADPAEWQPVQSDVPVLLLSGAYDPVTPPEWAADTATHLANSRHFEFRGGGHVQSDVDDCAAQYAADFFDDPDPASLAEPDCRRYREAADFSSVDPFSWLKW
jgi:pimeloyl-ACP methyl ester carboxylesterase